jgi:hypothetical protein
VLAAVVGAVAVLPSQARAWTEPRQQPFRVVIIPDLSLADLHRLQNRGAVGLLVPGVGPQTNRRRALAALIRGEVKNSLLGGVPRSRILIEAREARGLPTSHPTIVLGLPPKDPKGRLLRNDRRYPIAVLGGGYYGLLTSPTTRIPGLVSIKDIAATALRRSSGGLGWKETARPAVEVRALEQRIEANRDSKAPATLIVAALVALLALVRPLAALAAFPPLLFANLAVGALGVTSLGWQLATLAAAGALGGPLIARYARSDAALGAAMLSPLAAYMLAMAWNGSWVALAPFGPTQNSRFFGVGNLLETLLLPCAFAGTALLARRYGPLAFAGAASLALVAVAENRFGSDGGGAIVLGAGFAVLAALLSRKRARALAVALPAAALIVLALVSYDLRAPMPNHLRSAFAAGADGLAEVMRNRVPLAYEPALQRWYVIPLLLTLVALAVWALRGTHTHGRREVLVTFLAAVGVSLVINDSADYVLLAGVAGLIALARVERPFGPVAPLNVPRPLPQPVPAEVVVREG